MIKKIMTGLIIILAVFLIFLGFKDEKISYLVLGTNNEYTEKVVNYLDINMENYIDHTSNSKRTTDIIKDIENNIVVHTDKNRTFQNLLIKADLITISIGEDEFLSDVDINYSLSKNDLYSKFSQFYVDLEEMFLNLREYCKEKIVFIGFYNQSDELNDFYSYINKKLDELTKKYDIYYINTNDEFEALNNDSLNQNGILNDFISNKIIECIKKE